MSSQSISPAAVGPVELIADYACEIGENPLWHSIERRLYWCDIPRGRLFRFDPESGVHEQCYQGRIVGGFTFQSDGALLLFMDRGTIAVWREGTLTEIVKEIPGELDSRFNDVIADPHGRVFCGTMATDKRTGRLYRLDLDGSLEVMLEGIRCSNGLAFTRDLKSLYYTDSFAQEIYLFDYSIEDGTLSNRRVYAKFEDEDGLPDGATIDSAGRLWSALWDGGAVARIGPDGKIETKIEFPARKVSSITFGGADYTDMYVTTAGGNIRETDGELAGSLFRCKSKVPGVPEFYSHIGLA